MQGVRGFGVAFMAIAVALVAGCLLFSSASVAEAKELASGNGSTELAVQSKSKVTWYAVGFQGKKAKVTKNGFWIKSKMSKGKSLKQVLHNPKTLAKKKRTFKLAKNVRFCGSDWMHFSKRPRKDVQSTIQLLIDGNYGGITFKVKNGKVVETRFGS